MDPSESNLKLYIAFGPAAMQRIIVEGIVDNNAVFNGWIPLKATPGIATHSAMSAANSHPDAAAWVGEVEYFVLEITFTARQVAGLFLAKVLTHREREQGAFYYKQALQLIPENCSWCWLQANCRNCQTTSGQAPAMAVNGFCTVCWHCKPKTQEQYGDY
jgi:hypothetical protein